MGMTMTQKILAAHAGLDHVVAGQLIEAKLDMVLGNDVTSQDFRWKNNTGMPIKIKMSVKDGTISCKFYTSKEAKPKKVSLKVSQSGKNFTLRRYVGGKVNYTAKSKY